MSDTMNSNLSTEGYVRSEIEKAVLAVVSKESRVDDPEVAEAVMMAISKTCSRLEREGYISPEIYRNCLSALFE